MRTLVIAIAIALLPAMALAQQVETSKLNSGAIVEGASARAPKLNSGAIVEGADARSPKFIAGAVVEASMQASKFVAGAVVSGLPSAGGIVRQPFTHW